MERKMFGHHMKRKAQTGRVPGEPFDQAGYVHGEEDEESYEYAKGKDFPQKEKGVSSEKAKDTPPGYEGKEHVKYKDPGYSPHHIKYPEDEPHMKSHVSSDESHEAEDNYHKSLPDQTKYSLEKKLKRARMKMDSPDQEDPDELRGNLVSSIGQGEIDTSGEEEMGPNEMQSAMPKEQRKKMIAAVTRRKMKKGSAMGRGSKY